MIRVDVAAVATPSSPRPAPGIEGAKAPTIQDGDQSVATGTPVEYCFDLRAEPADGVDVAEVLVGYLRVAAATQSSNFLDHAAGPASTVGRLRRPRLAGRGSRRRFSVQVRLG